METNNKQYSFSVEDVRGIHQALADFYERQLHPTNEPPNEDVVRIDHVEEIDEINMHGQYGVGKGWATPILATFCDKEAREGYNSMKAHEYREDPVTLKEKIKALAELINMSERCVAYTGAGISTSSGIDDYASSNNKNSLATGSNAKGRVKRSGLDAPPTFAHYTLAALHKEGKLKHWVQQNHDGLPQKAGFPQEAINEIHGAWFDPSNPVVPMSGTLRGDLMEMLRQWEHAADLVIAIGTSLCGMNADRMVKTCSKKFINQNEGLGSVIIGFQRTVLDHMCTLRIFQSIDEVMLLLAMEMNLPISLVPYKPDIPQECIVGEHKFRVPYRKNGKLSTTRTIVWDLSPGAKLQLTGGPGVGFEGFMVSTPRNDEDIAYVCQFPVTREGSKEFGKFQSKYCLGSWFVEAACKGKLDLLPVINIDDTEEVIIDNVDG